jgi:Fe2+ or Zn2+ uptake regulation protein
MFKIPNGIMKRGPKPLGTQLTLKILEILADAHYDLRAWTITVRLRQVTGRPNLKWETVHNHLEKMVQEQIIFRYEDPSGIVTYSKNPIVREKVLF